MYSCMALEFCSGTHLGHLGVDNHTLTDAKIIRDHLATKSHSKLCSEDFPVLNNSISALSKYPTFVDNLTSLTFEVTILKHSRPSQVVDLYSYYCVWEHPAITGRVHEPTEIALWIQPSNLIVEMYKWECETLVRWGAIIKALAKKRPKPGSSMITGCNK